MCYLRFIDAATCFSLPLDAINPGLLGRQIFEHRMIDKKPKIVNDDVVCYSIGYSYRFVLLLLSRSHLIHRVARNGIAFVILPTRKKSFFTMGR